MKTRLRSYRNRKLPKYQLGTSGQQGFDYGTNNSNYGRMTDMYGNTQPGNSIQIGNNQLSNLYGQGQPQFQYTSRAGELGMGQQPQAPTVNMEVGNDADPSPGGKSAGSAAGSAINAASNMVGPIADAATGEMPEMSGGPTPEQQARIKKAKRGMRDSTIASTVGSTLASTSAAWGPLAWIPLAAGGTMVAVSEGVKHGKYGKDLKDAMRDTRRGVKLGNDQAANRLDGVQRMRQKNRGRLSNGPWGTLSGDLADSYLLQNQKEMRRPYGGMPGYMDFADRGNTYAQPRRYRTGGPAGPVSGPRPNANVEARETIERPGIQPDVKIPDSAGTHESRKGGADIRLGPNDYVWSDHLKMEDPNAPGTQISFAEMYDRLSAHNAPDHIIDRLRDMQETAAGRTPQKQTSGGLAKYQGGTPGGAAPTLTPAQQRAYLLSIGHALGNTYLPGMNQLGKNTKKRTPKAPLERSKFGKLIYGNEGAIMDTIGMGVNLATLLGQKNKRVAPIKYTQVSTQPVHAGQVRDTSRETRASDYRALIDVARNFGGNSTLTASQRAFVEKGKMDREAAAEIGNLNVMNQLRADEGNREAQLKVDELNRVGSRLAQQSNRDEALRRIGFENARLANIGSSLNTYANQIGNRIGERQLIDSYEVSGLNREFNYARRLRELTAEGKTYDAAMKKINEEQADILEARK